MAICCFYSFYDKFLHEIKYVQGLKVMPTQEHLPANVLNQYPVPEGMCGKRIDHFLQNDA